MCAKLGVAVGMRGALLRLAVGLQAVAQPAQQLRDGREMHLVTHSAQRDRELTHTLRRPQQRRLRVTARISLHQRLQIRKQRRIALGQRLATSTRPTHPPHRQPLTRLKLPDPLTDRVLMNPRRPRRRLDPAPPIRPRLRRRPQPPLTLIELASQRPEPLPNRRLVDHTPVVLHNQPNSST